MPGRDPYEVLGVSRSATSEEIRAAYRKLARKYHPDVNRTDPDAESKFKEIGEAYAILSDDEKRARFDRFGTTDDQGFSGGGGQYAGGDFGDLFDMFFGNMGGGGQPRARSMARDGIDVQTSVKLSYLDLLNGAKKSVDVDLHVPCTSCNGKGGEGGTMPEVCASCKGTGAVSRIQQTFIGQVRTQMNCPTCQGGGYTLKNPCKACRGVGVVTGKVTREFEVPPGVDHGARLHLSGEGGSGVHGGRPGDLYVRLLVEDDPRFEREGTTLYGRVDISFVQAVVGADVTFENIDGDVKFKVPAGTAPGTQLTQRGAGLPPLHGGRRGDLVVTVNIDVPKSLNEAQLKALKEFAAASGETWPEGSSGFLGGIFGKKK
jgi:molecular chaperone DnaJ